MADGRPGILLSLATLFCLIVNIQLGSGAYIGKFLGKLSELHHGVSGEVFAVDARTLHIKDFTYDGEGPAAYFYVGSSRSPSNTQGFRVRDETGNAGVLRRYRRKSITLTLPDGKNLNNVKWFSVWCDEFAVNFGDVKIPRNFEYPKPQKVEPLRGVHGISSDNVVIVDAQTLLIPNLSYDGEAPDAKFWVGTGPKPGPQGTRVPDENGKEIPLRRYDRKTVVLTLPGDLTVFNIGHFGIWCEAFTVDFGHIRIPSALNVPPSLKMLGVSPQKRARAIPLPGETNLLLPTSQQHQQHNGGQYEPTTYQPPNPFAKQQGGSPAAHAQDHAGALYQAQRQQLTQQLLFNRDQATSAGFNNQQQYQQQYYNNPHQQLVNQQQLYEQQLVQRRIGQGNSYNNQQLYNQQLGEQQAYNQLLNQRRFLEEQQLRERLSKNYNRFDLTPNNAAALFG